MSKKHILRLLNWLAWALYGVTVGVHISYTDKAFWVALTCIICISISSYALGRQSVYDFIDGDFE